MGERNRRLDAIEAARRCWGAASLLSGDDRETLIRVGTRYALKGLSAPAQGGVVGERRPPAVCRS